MPIKQIPKNKTIKLFTLTTIKLLTEKKIINKRKDSPCS